MFCCFLKCLLLGPVGRRVLEVAGFVGKRRVLVDSDAAVGARGAVAGMGLPPEALGALGPAGCPTEGQRGGHLREL